VKADPYPPLNTLKPVAEDIWIVDGPTIGFGPRWLKMPFPTRMTIIRFANELFIHSPTELSPELRREILRIGVPRWLVAPNRLHYWWIPDWRWAFPVADVYVAPRTRQQAGRHIDFPTHDLSKRASYPWDVAIATLPVAGRYMTEYVFFHRLSRSLILTDLVENFEPAKLSRLMRWLTRLGGVQAPNGAMPRDMRKTFSKPHLRRAIDTMLAWEPEHVILAHGHWYRTDGAAKLRRAFDWLLRE
jgi:hypothetical protein